ncbi:MAG TPA: nitrous oxide reductase accessory protein NosL, partial [Thermomicrobiaceae bacterium]|nr:nitrous oxide reductase accessory protein NosL [Thermomicrobiaceae bacterium]
MHKLSVVPVFGFLVLLTALMTACGSTASSSQPPHISYGQTTSTMGMIIEDPRFAGAIVDRDGKSTLFDDIGDLVAAAKQNPSSAAHIWVHDYQTKAWINGSTASYVASGDLMTMTPMGSGLAAFSSRDKATTFLHDHHGTVMTWSDVL